MMKLMFWLCIFFIVCNGGVSCDNVTVSVETKLIEYLLSGYNPNARPVRSADEPVNVLFDVAFNQILSVNEREQKLTTNTWLRQYWNNPGLRWNPSDWNNVTFVSIEPSALWKPDIALYNNAEREFQGLDEFGRLRITVYSDGSCAWLFPAVVKTHCKMDLQFFPFDEQFCPLVFGSWAHDEYGVNVTNKFASGDMSTFAESSEFLVEALPVKRDRIKYRCCKNFFIKVNYTVHLTRKSKFYFFNLLIPGGLISLLSCFSFLLPPLCGERTGLVITNFLSLSVYILMVSDSVPPSSNIPLLVSFYTILISEIGLALAINCIMIPLAARDTPLPPLIRKLFLQNLAYFLHCQRPEDVDRKNRENRNQSEHEENNNKPVHRRRESNNNAATNSYHNSLYEKHSADPESIAVDNFHQDLTFRQKSLLINNIVENTKRFSTDKTEGWQEVAHVVTEIYNIIKQEVDGKKNNGDWDQLIRIVDRLFFLVFLVTVSLSVGVTLGQAPKITF